MGGIHRQMPRQTHKTRRNVPRSPHKHILFILSEKNKLKIWRERELYGRVTENIWVSTDVYSNGVCLTDRVCTNFPCSANCSSRLFSYVRANPRWTRLHSIWFPFTVNKAAPLAPCIIHQQRTICGRLSLARAWKLWSLRNNGDRSVCLTVWAREGGSVFSALMHWG
jgi:hypothetical protein